MATESAIELDGDALRQGVLSLGHPSPNTCPECRGSLIEIREGPIVRYRCHTGHSYSLRTLLAETEVVIEKSLWNAARAIEERSLLLRTLEQGARESGDAALADRLAADAARDEADAQRVSRLTTGSASF
jgi:two-component system chemotaxis response regulator CheB